MSQYGYETVVADHLQPPLKCITYFKGPVTIVLARFAVDRALHLPGSIFSYESFSFIFRHQAL
jgi:hypothetical protein